MKNGKFQLIWGWGKSCQIPQVLCVSKVLCSLIHYSEVLHLNQLCC